MSQWSETGGLRRSRTSLGERPRVGALALALTAVLLLAVLWQRRWGTTPDVSWVVTMAEGVLDGKRLYVDLFETNPPFTLWLYLPPVALARAVGLAPEPVLHAYVYALVLAGIALAALVCARARFEENRALLALSPVVLAVFTVLVGNAFGDREQIGLALFLPLLALSAWRARTDAPARPGLGLAAAAGLAGSVLVLVKPYYAVLVLALSLYAAWRRRDPRLLFAPENWVIGTVACAYVASVLWLYPEFFETIYPLAASTYMQVVHRGTVLASYGLPYLVALYFFRKAAPRPGELAGASLSASLAALLPLVYQGKGWPYHAFPALALLSLAILCAAARNRVEAAPEPGLPATPRLLRSPLLLAVLVANWAPFLSTTRPDAALVAAVRAATVSPSVALIGSDLAQGHPLARLVDGRWTSSHVSDWLGDFALFLSDEAAQRGDSAEAARYRGIVDAFVALKRREFLAARPDLVIVTKTEQRWADALLHDYGFEAEMKAYRPLAADDAVTVFLRSDYGKPVPR